MMGKNKKFYTIEEKTDFTKISLFKVIRETSRTLEVAGDGITVKLYKKSLKTINSDIVLVPQLPKEKKSIWDYYSKNNKNLYYLKIYSKTNEIRVVTQSDVISAMCSCTKISKICKLQKIVNLSL